MKLRKLFLTRKNFWICLTPEGTYIAVPQQYFEMSGVSITPTGFKANQWVANTQQMVEYYQISSGEETTAVVKTAEELMTW